MDKLHAILSGFRIASSENTEIIPFGNGHINHTYLAKTTPPTVMQKVNANVFPEPVKVMENMAGITKHLEARIASEGGDPEMGTLRIVPAKDGLPYYIDGEGELYRLVYLINAHSIELADDPEKLYLCAKEFGRFLKLLSDYPVETLHETIVNFHNTPDRYAKFEAALAADAAGRAAGVADEIAFVKAREADCRVVTDAIASGEVPLRVTHNDTKLNNFLFDAAGNCTTLIDLDTVMPGSLLYDYGDALRFGSSSAKEDETDLSRVFCRVEYVAAFTRGFLEEFGEVLTARERELLPFSIKLMTLECGIRFLTDYLVGDTYFRTAYPTHNLDRARNQFALVKDIEGKLPELLRLVEA